MIVACKMLIDFKDRIHYQKPGRFERNKACVPSIKQQENGKPKQQTNHKS